MLRVASSPSNGSAEIAPVAQSTPIPSDRSTPAVNETGGVASQLKELQPDADFEFRHGNGETFLETTGDVQNFAKIRSPRFSLGTLRAKRDFESMAETKQNTRNSVKITTAIRTANHAPQYHQDIPAGHRIYLHENNEQLMQRYLDASIGVRPQDYAGRPLPYDVIRADILAALGLDPERHHDAEILRLAFRHIEIFMPIHHDVLATSCRERPDLRAHLQHAAQEILKTAVQGALADKKINQQLVAASELIAAATRHRSAIQRQDSRSYYAKPGRIPGSGEHATQDEIGRLASGRIEYPSATELLRYGPVGAIFHQWSHQSHHYQTSMPQPPTDWHEPHVSYPGGQVVELYYREHYGSHGTRPRSILLAQDGYIVQHENIQHYPEVVSDEARQENLERLNLLVGHARERLGLPRLARISAVPPETAPRDRYPR